MHTNQKSGNGFEIISGKTMVDGNLLNLPSMRQDIGRAALSNSGCRVTEEGRPSVQQVCKEGNENYENSKSVDVLEDKNGVTVVVCNAVMRGIMEVMKLLLDECAESVKEMGGIGIGRTATDFSTGMNCGGNMDLHLATLGRLIQTLKGLLSECDRNMSNYGDIDIEIGKMLAKERVLRGSDLPSGKEGVRNKPLDNTMKAIINSRRVYAYNALLVMATLIATITYRAAFSRLGGGSLKEGYAYNCNANGTLQLKKRDSIMMTHSFILFNSTGFVASVAMIMFLLNEFPLKPWPQISVSTLFGSYMCSIMAATSPAEAVPLLLFLAIPLLLLAAAGKLYGFARSY